MCVCVCVCACVCVCVCVCAVVCGCVCVCVYAQVPMKAPHILLYDNNNNLIKNFSSLGVLFTHKNLCIQSLFFTVI